VQSESGRLESANRGPLALRGLDPLSPIKSVLKSLQVNSSRVYLDRQVADLASSLNVDARVLDAGAGICPYRTHFNNVRYESADFCQIDKDYGHIDHVCDLSHVPVDDEHYDVVLLTQVLEHTPEPLRVLVEMHRLLKPGGVLFCSAPLYYEEHEVPFDFFRYTQFGLSRLLSESGFAVQRMDWLEGYLGTLSHQLEVAARCLPIRPRHYGNGIRGWLAAALALAMKPLFFALSLVLSRLDVRHRYTASGHCKNYFAIALKASPS
jgi:SAM-dependent methyltransferase